jgi:hypothetical protein
MTIATMTATERLAAYRSHHRIEVDRSSEWDRCDTDGIRVYQVLTRRWQHDPNEIKKLEEQARVEAVINEASAPLRLMELIVEDHGGYVVTADVELPAHNHFDIWDANDGCPRCRYDVARAGG